MSCYCEKIDARGHEPGCPCDIRIHPPKLDIPAGLSRIPRQIATFPEFRTAMLAMMQEKPALHDWRARGEDDLGLMLLEMWAYVCDSLSFYDEVIAQEAYLRTAQERPSRRKLVGLLGYLPRPAVASFAKLAAFADGRQAVKLPAGTVFRTGAFEGEPPQVFELDVETSIHPLLNRWNIKPPVPEDVGASNPAFLYVEARAEITEGTVLLLTDSVNSLQNQPAVVNKVEMVTSLDDRLMLKVHFTLPLKLAGSTPLNRLRLLVPTQSAGLWSLSSSPVSVESSALTLDNLYRNIRAKDKILVSKGGDHRWFTVNDFSEVVRAASAQNNMVIGGKIYNVTGNASFTRLSLDHNINISPRKRTSATNWSNSHRNEIIVRYGMREAGIVVHPAKKVLEANDSLILSPPLETPANGQTSQQFLLEDKNKRGEEAGGNVNLDTGTLTLNQGEGWQAPLSLPVEVFGNVIQVSRGERVDREILGSGNAAIPNQTFKLKKKPLTYLPAPTADNDQGVKSTLNIYVNGIRWSEVAGFFRRDKNEHIYIIRQNDEGETLITFGDGIRGERLPSGRDNIIAFYRYGAGAASPPAGAINQIGKPVKGLQSVRNVLPATGGADAASGEEIRRYAPGSVLILGRAVSIHDMEAVALSVPGVRAAQASWYWNGAKQRPVVNVYFIGESGIETLVRQRLRNVSDPSTPIDAAQAQALLPVLSIDVNIDPRYLEHDVLTAIREALMNARTGMLAPENIGIGQPLFRSRIFSAVLSVEGALAVRGIHWNNQPFLSSATTPGTGIYFNIEEGTLLLNGKDN